MSNAFFIWFYDMNGHALDYQRLQVTNGIINRCHDSRLENIMSLSVFKMINGSICIPADEIVISLVGLSYV